MNKPISKIAAFTLICLPFLAGINSFAQTEEATTKSSTTELVTTDTTSEKSNSERADSVKWKDMTLKLDTATATGMVGQAKGEFKLNSKQDSVFDNLELTGKFKEVSSKTIHIDKNGSWTALAATKNEKIILEYLFDRDTQEALSDIYPDVDFSQPFEVEEATLNFSEKVDEKADISLEVVGGLLDSVEGNQENGKFIKVKVKDGDEVQGVFTPIDSDSFKLDEKGNYLIPKEARYKKLNQEVEFTLDTTSYDKLVALPENKDKDVERVYTFDVAKKAQKDIIIKFRNQKIDTIIGGQGRLLLEDTVEGVKIVEPEKVTFKPLENNDFLNIDELGNWKALKAGKGPLKPAVILDEKTITALETEFEDYDLNIDSDTIEVFINQNGTGGNSKTYQPVKTLPQTGEQKLRFASVIGVAVIAITAILFFLKKRKQD